MKIGIEGRSLREPLTGIGRYTHEMIAQLVALGCDARVYLPRSGEYRIPSGAAAERFGALLGIPWLTFEVPGRAARDRIDVLWGPAHRLPLFLGPRAAAVVTIHDLVWVHAAETMHLRTLWGERLLMTPSVRAADAVVTDSAATARDVSARFGTRAKDIVTIYPGTPQLSAGTDMADLTRFGIDRPFALFVGTLEPRKNLVRLLEAYASLAPSVRAACMLVIVGGRGWGGLDVHELIARNGIAADVRILGYVPDSELAALYGSCRFLAMPSLYEGFGFPVLEANAQGAPALVGNTSSLPEVAGDAALHVDPHDVASIARGMHTLITDDARHAELASRAPANAARFSWTKAAGELIGLFSRLASERAARA